MIRGAKYKIARRLGPAIFDKTQTQKFALRSERREVKRGGPKSDYGIQMLEKQKARFTYGVSERQFSNYVKSSVAKKGVNSVAMLYADLEQRLDNVVYRLGFASTRAAGRQMVSHGHITINGKKVTIPSFQVGAGDKISIREGSKKSPMFAELEKNMKEKPAPSWISWNPDTQIAQVEGVPKAPLTELPFDLGAVVEFYSR